ncbi:MAG: RIP metalloprotease RseP [Betaproteobacteria bacterium]
MTILTTIIAFAVALGTLVVVHEFGHYLAARLCNVKVLRFSVGFGRVLASRRLGRDQTEWALAAFPLGGYVKMLDEREGEVAAQDLPRAFNRQSVGRRFLIVVAGPVANFLLAIGLYWLIFMHGVPGLKPVIGGIAAGSPAAHAQFEAGEIIVKIGADAVTTWQDARWILLKYAVDRSSVAIEVQNDRAEIHFRKLDMAGLKTADLDGDFLRTLGFARPQPPLAPVIGRVIAGGPADRAGVLPGDQVLAIDGVAVRRWDEVVAAIGANPAREVMLEIKRGDTVQKFRITPDAVIENSGRIGRIGVAVKVDADAMRRYMVEVRYTPWASMGKAVERTWDTSFFSLRMLGKMIVGEVSLKNLSGPITIADYAGQSAQTGWISYLAFIALISISLGVLNLLPIPLLDGGHLMYYMLEIVKGSPVSTQVMEIGQNIGMGLLFMLMAFALYNDISRLLNG